MQIANPIYDVVFKYMMNDNKVAKLFLSAIIGEEIIELSFEPTETLLSLQQSITVLRMDFKAKIQQADGSQKVIIIEIQKAKLHTDIMRFRRYLAQQYADKENSIIEGTYRKGGKDIPKRKALPILSIYFLGHELDYIKDVPVIKVERTYIDVATGEVLEAKEDFIESLTHDSFIIQIPNIHGHRRTELEQLLHLFDQGQVDDTSGTKHFLDIDENDLPERYRPILRRLLKAFANPKVRETMTAEDEILEELQGYSRKTEYFKEERDKAIEEKDKAIEEKDKAIEEKAKAIEKGILQMLKFNIPIADIAKSFDVDETEVLKLKNK